MSNCELCGKDTQLFRADIEGTELDVCKTCGSFGKIISPKETNKQLIKKRPTALPEELQLTEAVTSDFSKIVKTAREHKKLTQEEFAKILKEKESIIHKIETGSLEPSISLAKKLEKALNVKLIKMVQEENLPERKRSGPITIGDIIKRK